LTKNDAVICTASTLLPCIQNCINSNNNLVVKIIVMNNKLVSIYSIEK
jgi:hypothetical protein